MTIKTTKGVYTPPFNELVRAAAQAQEGFDNWDEGKTVVDGREVRCSLAATIQEWRDANIALIRYAQHYGDDIILEEGNG